MRSLWKLEVIVIDTTTTVISESFEILCQATALLLTEHGRLAQASFREHFAFSPDITAPPLHLVQSEMPCINWGNAKRSLNGLCWVSNCLCPQCSSGSCSVAVSNALISSYHGNPTHMAHTYLHWFNLDQCNNIEITIQSYQLLYVAKSDMP